MDGILLLLPVCHSGGLLQLILAPLSWATLDHSDQLWHSKTGAQPEKVQNIDQHP
jgi:hypothetical protein